jgi:Homocysteine S-methyltransferase
MTTEEATAYHAHQIGAFAEAGADIVTRMTITNANEAIGVVRAARAAGMPVVISFTLETDGRLPAGQPLSEAIRDVDTATEGAPAYYMLNCAHPTHFEHALETASWMERSRGIRANASKRSRTGRGSRPGGWRTRRTRGAIRGDPRAFPWDHRARWLLRHGPSPYRADLQRVPRGGLEKEVIILDLNVVGAATLRVAAAPPPRTRSARLIR